MPIEPQNERRLAPCCRILGRPGTTERYRRRAARPCCEPAWLTELAHRRPDFVFMAPYLAYLLLLPVKDWVPAAYLPWATAARGILGLAGLLARSPPSAAAGQGSLAGGHRRRPAHRRPVGRRPAPAQQPLGRASAVGSSSSLAAPR